MSNIPKMYKSQFEFIADSINKTLYQEAHPELREKLLIKNLAEELSKTNPNFNKELFIERCELGKK